MVVPQNQRGHWVLESDGVDGVGAEHAFVGAEFWTSTIGEARFGNSFLGQRPKLPCPRSRWPRTTGRLDALAALHGAEKPDSTNVTAWIARPEVDDFVLAGPVGDNGAGLSMRAELKPQP